MLFRSSVLITLLSLVLLVGCGDGLSGSATGRNVAEPTPNIDATVEAIIAQERAIDATEEAQAQVFSGSVGNVPSATQEPTAIPTPLPTLG